MIAPLIKTIVLILPVLNGLEIAPALR